MIFIDKLSKKERIGLFAAVLFIVLVVMDKFVVTPIGGRIYQLDQERKTAEKRLVKYLRDMDRKEAIASDYSQYVSHIKSTGSNEEDTAKILAEIEELVRTSSLSIIDMKPQAPKKASFYKEYVVEIDAEGEMESMIKFLYRASNSAQLLRAEKVRLQLKDKKSTIVKGFILVTKLVVL